uniref:Uncharacterized protein n=1 Tax=Rhizophora mucronata TaxID=61149 RepID=A0A2P2QCP0_RHIMU
MNLINAKYISSIGMITFIQLAKTKLYPVQPGLQSPCCAPFDGDAKCLQLLPSVIIISVILLFLILIVRK